MPEIHALISPVRSLVVKSLSRVEDLIYIGVGVLLALSAVALLGAGFKTFIVSLAEHTLGNQFVLLLDQILQILLVVELLYTVQVSFREHGLVAEPFLVVALIAVIRRILVVTAEAAHLPDANAAVFTRALLELGLLTVMVLVLVGSLIVLQGHAKQPE
jgi:uncharacterized membrane protein (DUF373 family)